MVIWSHCSQFGFYQLKLFVYFAVFLSNKDLKKTHSTSKGFELGLTELRGKMVTKTTTISISLMLNIVEGD